METIRSSLLCISLLSLVACGLGGGGVRPVASLYCDNFLLYDLCAMDMDRDGVVEFVYFKDTEEVFMWREGARGDVPSDMKIHQCAETMDEALVTTTSRVFFVDDETSYLEKQDIRGAMFIRYMAKLPGLAACKLRAEQAEAES